MTETLKIEVKEEIKTAEIAPGNRGNNVEALKVEAEDDIKTTEKSPGTLDNKNEEKLPKEELEKRQRIMNEYTRLLGRYCEPHSKKARWVTSDDIERVIKDGQDLVAMCSLPRGKYSGIAALAHSQIDNKNPLRFFVLPTGMIIINPVIINHTNTEIMKPEACMSHPEKDILPKVPRYNKVTVLYQTLITKALEDKPTLSEPSEENMGGWKGHVFQHEISHLNGADIYSENFSSKSCEGLGKGLLSESQARRLYL